jgi:hypothetical protein
MELTAAVMIARSLSLGSNGLPFLDNIVLWRNNQHTISEKKSEDNVRKSEAHVSVRTVPLA